MSLIAKPAIFFSIGDISGYKSSNHIHIISEMESSKVALFGSFFRFKK